MKKLTAFEFKSCRRKRVVHTLAMKPLNTQHACILQMHCYDKGVKLEETLRAFNDLVRSGKVRYVGLSNFTGSVLQKVMDYNHFMGFNAG